MVQETSWSHQPDKDFVDAVHTAIRSRYGMLAEKARERNELVRFDREYEKIRVGLTRIKNPQTMRAELAELFSRSGINKVLQEKWQELLPIIAGDDWQRARDLAMLALASYKGKGAEQVKPETENNEQEEQ